MKKYAFCCIFELQECYGDFYISIWLWKLNPYCFRYLNLLPWILEFHASLLYLKKIIQTLCCFGFKSELLFIFSQIVFIFSIALSESKGLTVFQNFLLWITFSLFKFSKYFFSLFQKRHTFIPLFYTKLTGFFCFLFLKVAPQSWSFHYFYWEFFRYKRHLIGSDKYFFNRSKTV